MVSLDAPWIAPHADNYQFVLERAKTARPQTVDQFLSGPALDILGAILDPAVYVVDLENKRIDFRTDPAEGDPCLYWMGDSLGQRGYDMREYKLGAFYALAQSVVRIANTLPAPPLVLDLGAGTCLQAIVLRGIGSTLPVLCLDVFQSALEIGQILCAKLGLSNIGFAGIDLSGPSLGELRGIVQNFGERPVIVLSRHAIYPFYSRAEYTRLFDYLINDLGVSAGLHLERTGRFTPSFARLQAEVPFPLKIPGKHEGKTEDPLHDLMARPDVLITDHQEIIPHYLNKYFPRYLAWVLIASGTARSGQ